MGTTSAINGRSYLFNLKHFSLAIIDEASQILEPELIGILSAQDTAGNAIDKFVLVGDYKQLPAIAQQSETEAKVTDPQSSWNPSLSRIRKKHFLIVSSNPKMI